MKKEKRSNAVFYGLMGIMLGLFVISLIATGGKSIYQFLFYDRKDIFMDFFNSAVEVLQTLVVALGGGLCVWGGINLLEGYGNDNPGANAHIR